MTEQPCESGRENDTCRGQYPCFYDYRSGLFPSGAESAVEHYEDQGDGTDVFGDAEIVECYLYYSVRAENHTQQDECQQHGDADLVGYVVKYDAQDDNNSGDKQEDSYGHKNAV